MVSCQNWLIYNLQLFQAWKTVTALRENVPGRSEYKRTKFQKWAECLKLINFSSILGLTTVKQAYCNENSLHKIQVIFGRILLSRISGIKILLLDQPDHKLIWNLHHIFLLMFPTKEKKKWHKKEFDQNELLHTAELPGLSFCYVILFLNNIIKAIIVVP